RIQGVRHSRLVEDLTRLTECDLGKRPPLDQLVIVRVAKLVVVGDQRMHAVDRDELLGDRVRHTEVVRWRAWYPAPNLTLGDAPPDLVHRLARKSPPIRSQRQLSRGVAEDARSPLDGMDLGDQRRVDEARMVEQRLV